MSKYILIACLLITSCRPSVKSTITFEVTYTNGDKEKFTYGEYENFRMIKLNDGCVGVLYDIDAFHDLNICQVRTVRLLQDKRYEQ